MNTCDTCKWWNKEWIGQGFNPIQNKCVNEKVVGRKMPRHDNENILMISTSESWSGLFTGPKFGCLHHEAHEVSDADGKLRLEGLANGK